MGNIFPILSPFIKLREHLAWSGERLSVSGVRGAWSRVEPGGAGGAGGGKESPEAGGQGRSARKVMEKQVFRKSGMSSLSVLKLS